MEVTLQDAKEIIDIWQHAEALHVLALYFPEVLPEALQTVRVIVDRGDQATILRELALTYPEVLPEALQAVMDIECGDHRVQALHILAPHLTPELLTLALKDTREISDGEERAEALSGLSKFMLCNDWLSLIKESCETRSIELSCSLASSWVECHKGKRIDTALPLHDLLRNKRKLLRSDLIKTMTCFTSVIQKLGGDETLRDIADGFSRVGKWWP